MTNYIELCNKIILDIESNDALEILKKDFRLNYQDADEIIDDCKELNYSLSKSLIDFYLQVQQFEIEWRIKRPKDITFFNNEQCNCPVNGSIKIHPYWHILPEERWDDIIWFVDDDPEVLKKERQLRPFDYFNCDLSGSACFLIGPNNHITDDLFFFSHEGGYWMKDDYTDDSYFGSMKSGLNIAEYFDLLAKTRGYSTWQRVFEERIRGRGASTIVLEYNHYMSQLFDDYEF